MSRTYYRAVDSWPVSRHDFTSDQEKGRDPRPEQVTDPRLYVGISVFDRPERIAERRARYRRFPRLTVELLIPDGAPVQVEKTLGRGHFTLIGDASVLMGYVVGLVE